MFEITGLSRLSLQTVTIGFAFSRQEADMMAKQEDAGKYYGITIKKIRVGR